MQPMLNFMPMKNLCVCAIRQTCLCTKLVQGSNYCDVAPIWDARTKRIVVVSCIDNLVKGASGQAIQNMNLMMGLDEGMGLRYGVMYP